jgi:hypothetical protein
MSIKPKSYRTLLLSVGAALSLSLPTGALADDSKQILKAMSDYLASQKSMSFDYQSSIEAVTPDFEKLQFVSSGTAVINRPDKLRVTRRGGFADLDISFDGSTFVVHGKNMDAYALVDAKGSLDDLFNDMANEGVMAPGTDLFSTDTYDLLLQDVTESKHIASAVVNGIDCEYLTFRTPDIDWQIWIESGAKPVPLKYVITTKHVAQAPQYTLEITNFRTGADVAITSFKIEPPADAKELDLSQMEMIDELPDASGTAGDQQ